MRIFLLGLLVVQLQSLMSMNDQQVVNGLQLLRTQANKGNEVSKAVLAAWNNLINDNKYVVHGKIKKTLLGLELITPRGAINPSVRSIVMGE